MIAAHRRHHASQLASRETIPVIVRDMDDDAATILMVDSNLQRETILPSERAFAFKMKLDAMKRQGIRTDLTSVQVRAVDKPSPFFKLHDKMEEKTGWNGYADTDRRQAT